MARLQSIRGVCGFGGSGAQASAGALPNRCHAPRKPDTEKRPAPAGPAPTRLPGGPKAVTHAAPIFDVSLARDEAETAEALRLRYDVFVREMGADGPMVDHARGLERDRFDAHARMLVLRDVARPSGQRIVGVYRLIGPDGPFYSEQEFDLSPLRATGRRLLELGRSCLHPAYRGGSAMYHLWHGLAGLVAEEGVDVLFGAASFPGTDPARLAAPLALLHHNHLAPAELRVRARAYQSMDLAPAETIDRLHAMRAVPALIKAYLRLGGFVGDGAFVDRGFNTVDVCLILDTARMNARQRAIYTTPGRG